MNVRKLLNIRGLNAMDVSCVLKISVDKAEDKIKNVEFTISEMKCLANKLGLNIALFFQWEDNKKANKKSNDTLSVLLFLMMFP